METSEAWDEMISFGLDWIGDVGTSRRQIEMILSPGAYQVTLNGATTNTANFAIQVIRPGREKEIIYFDENLTASLNLYVSESSRIQLRPYHHGHTNFYFYFDSIDIQKINIDN